MRRCVGQHARMSKLISKYRPEEFSVIANFLEQTTHVPAEEAKRLRKNSDTGSTESGAPLVCFCNNLFVPQDQQAVERLPAVEASVQSPAARFKTVSIGPGWILLTVMWSFDERGNKVRQGSEISSWMSVPILVKSAVKSGTTKHPVL